MQQPVEYVKQTNKQTNTKKQNKWAKPKIMSAVPTIAQQVVELHRYDINVLH